ncbi:MAG TPA: MFS transporter [Candidatus Sulfotelmatobacter sp.]|nr:MFS transporter [Candidatus Sulfotelmatobacter sp.]
MQTFASLRRHRNYRLYFTGQLVSQIGTWLQTAAQSWLVLDLTHSAIAVGVVSFCFYGPYAVLGLLGGALADRVSRHRLMMATQGAMALCAAALALIVFLHVDRVWVIDLIAVIRGVVLVFNNPSRQALMVQLVGRGELANAIALNSGLNNATRIVGPGIAGVLIATVGTGWCFALNAVSYLAVIAALGAMREHEFHPTPGIQRRTPLLRSIADGLRYARKTKTITVVLAMLLVISLFAINFNVLLPVLARQTLHGGPQVYGLIAASFGAGAFIGALIVASRERASPRVLLAAACGFGAAQIGLAFERSTLGDALVLVVVGVCYTLYTASTNALVQLATPGFLQGRIGGLYSYVFLATGPFGALLVGWLSERGGTDLAFLVGGIGTLVMVVFGLATRPWPMPTGTLRARRRATTSS